MGNIQYKEYSLDDSCPKGYANDRWMLFDHNIGKCTIPIEFVYYFSHIFSVFNTLVCLLLLHSTYVHVKLGNKSIAFFTFWSFVSGVFLTAWTQTIGKRVMWAYPTMGIYLTTFILSIIFAVKHIITAIPDSLLNHINKERNFLTKDKVIQFLFYSCLISLFAYFILTVILIPIFYNDEHIAQILFQLSCALMALMVATTTTIGNRGLMIMVNLIDSVLKSNLYKSDSVETTQNMKNVRDRLRRAAIVGLFGGYIPMLLWLFYAIFLPYYWYLALIKMIGAQCMYLSILAMYYTDTLKACFGMQAAGKGSGSFDKSNGTAVKPSNLRSDSSTNEQKIAGSSVVLPMHQS